MDYLTALLTNPAAWMALLALTTMEIVLGIDNLIFISILSNKLPVEQRSKARRIGIGAALILRLLLLATVVHIVRLTEPVFSVFDQAFSWRDMILIVGGLFLVWKATREIHHKVDPDPGPDTLNPAVVATSLALIVAQILVLDVVFSIDSILTAIGMTDHIPIMVVAVIVAVAVMMIAANPLANFIHDNPTIVMLALGFLLLIGTTLIADGFGAHLPKGYIYAAMAFSVMIEGLNMLQRRARQKRLKSTAATRE
ncbi:MAG: TerC family protein [Gammaproteobacteria bacterium]|nr:TerC family protein [Gammaproteobacteria bacterium]MBT8436195.1 TerC family protein [Gammaproteobacteria bacterium]